MRCRYGRRVANVNCEGGLGWTPNGFRPKIINTKAAELLGWDGSWTGQRRLRTQSVERVASGEGGKVATLNPVDLHKCARAKKTTDATSLEAG